MLIEQIQNGTTPYYYHADQLGSIRALTNQAGSVVNTYSYDAYGNTTSSTGTLANPFKYAASYTDSASGLLYLRARYYDPATQQFLTVDPLLAWTEQGYAYVSGSPLNLIDPSGLDKNCRLLGSPFDQQSCFNEGLRHPAAPWVILGGAIVATGGIACVAGGCEAAAAALGIGAATAPAVEADLEAATTSSEATIQEGDFCITQWYQRTYPTSGGIELPKGPFRLINGQAYDAARTAAKTANRGIRSFAGKLDPTALEGQEIHEIWPIKFGGSPTDMTNKIILPESIHSEYTTWWTILQRSIEGR